MTDTVTPPAPAAPAIPAAVAPVEVPAGFVPQADLDRVENQRKGFQSEVERLKSELATAKTPAPAPSSATGDVASEIASLRAEITRAGQLAANQASVPALKTEFPHADPSLFSADKVAAFGSPEALRAAVEADHSRIAAIVAAAETAKEEALKAALAGSSPLGPVAPPVAGVDPTPEQLNKLTPLELDAYMKANPGVVERVMSAAMATG